MSVPVSPEALAARIAAFGPHAHLVTVGPDARPHVVSVLVRVEGDRLVADAGRTTSGNVAANPSVTFVWPAAPGEDHSLLVDATATAAEGTVVATPSRAILHRVAIATGDGPPCVDVA